MACQRGLSQIEIRPEAGMKNASIRLVNQSERMTFIGRFIAMR
jgi:hypothetical protein